MPKKNREAKILLIGKKSLIGFMIARASVCLFILALVGCSGSQVDQLPYGGTYTPCEPKFAKKAYNRTYEIKGVTYTPQPHYELNEIGIASYYGGTDIFHGRTTSNGEIFDMNRISAAHKTLPIPCIVRVTNLENGRSLKVKINDRGPFIEGRIIDVSRKTAQLLGFYHKGTAKVHVETVMPDTILLARGHLNDETIQLAEVSNEAPPLTSLPVVASSKVVSSRASSSAAAPHQRMKHTKKRNNGEIYLASNDNNKDIGVREKMVGASAINVSVPSQANASSSLIPAKAPHPVRPLVKPAVYNPLVQLPPVIRGSRGYFVQAGVFRSSASAQSVHKKLQKLLAPPYVKLESASFGSVKIFRILVGPFRSSQEAKTLLKKVSLAGHEEAVIVYNG